MGSRPATSAERRAIFAARALTEGSPPPSSLPLWGRAGRDTLWVRSRRISSSPRCTAWPTLTRIASTIPPSRFEITCRCELATTRPMPLTVRSSLVSDAQVKKATKKIATTQSSTLDAARGRIRPARSSIWVWWTFIGSGRPRRRRLRLGDPLQHLVARPVGDDPAALDQQDPRDEGEQRRPVGDEDEGAVLELAL